MCKTAVTAGGVTMTLWTSTAHWSREKKAHRIL